MNTPFWRTDKTDLTDDELILFDVMFDGCGYSHWHLRREELWRFSIPSSHTFDGLQLRQALDRLTNCGFFEEYESEPDPRYPMTPPGPYYTITPFGGQLWELEREPNWNLFYCWESGWEESGNEYEHIQSQSLETASAVFELGREGSLDGLFPVDVQQSYIHEPDDEPVAWKKFAGFHELRWTPRSFSDAEITELYRTAPVLQLICFHYSGQWFKTHQKK